MSKKKAVFITIVSVFLVVAIIVGILFVIKGKQKGSVNVYSVADFAYYDDYGTEDMSYGWVKTDRIQSVYVSDTQKITEVFVTEGQQIKAGDKLLAYDTTLTDLELKKKDVEIQRIQMNLQNAEKELREIRSYKPYVPQPEPSPEPEPTPVPLPVPSRMGGSGSAEDPYLYLWDESEVFSQKFIRGLFDGTERTEVYAQFYVYEQNSLNLAKLSSWGMVFYAGEEEYTFTVYSVGDELGDPSTVVPTDAPELEEITSGFTAKEIAQMISEKEAEIKTLNISLKVAQVDYRQMEKELSDGIVVSEFDGVAISVLDEEEAYSGGLPIVKISGGGGYIVEVAVGEFALDQIAIGQEVMINSFNTGMMISGTVKAISSTPTQNADAFTKGNTNISFYPVTVSVDENAGLQEEEYVSVTFSSSVGSSHYFCLDAAFVRNIDGKTVVFVEENGKLVKREILTGKTNWNGAYEIRNGLTMDEYISFPYGNGCKEGTVTKQATMDEFYNW